MMQTSVSPISTPLTSTHILKVQNLNAGYLGSQVLHQLSFDLHKGEVLALMGRNGAGKSTTFKAIMGLLPECTGQIELMGQSIENLAPYKIAQLGLAYVPEDRRLFTDLTVLENLKVGQQAARFWPNGQAAPAWTTEQIFDLFPNLANMPHRLAGQMSGGEQKMLSVARSLMGNPFMVMLDEPSEGVAPIIVEQMAEVILQLKAQGLSILLSEQNMFFAQDLADRAILLDKGQISFNGSLNDLKAHY